jgi:hypothetical protein
VIRGVRRSVWVLRGVAALGPMVALWAAAPEGHVPQAWVVAVVALLSVGYAVRPEHFVGSTVLVVVLVWWTINVRAEMPTGALVAAAAVLAAHVAGVLLGYGPSQMAVDPELVVIWVVRSVLVWLAAPAVWFAARVYNGQATPTSFWLAGLATALVGAVVAAVVVPARDLGTRP